MITPYKNYSTTPQPGYWHWYSQVQNISSTTRMPPIALLQPCPLPTPSSLPAPSNHQSVLHFYNFVILRMLYKWNPTVYDFWGLIFSISISLELHPGWCVYQWFIAFNCWVVSLVWMNYSLFSHYPLKDIWVVFSLGLLRIMLLWTFMYSFLCEHKFLFLWDKCSGMLLLGHMFSFTRNCYTVFQRGCSISHPTITAGEVQLLSNLTSTWHCQLLAVVFVFLFLFFTLVF